MKIFKLIAFTILVTFTTSSFAQEEGKSTLEKVMEKNSIAILIEKKNIFIAKSNYDITEIVIEEINKDIKDFLIE